MQESSMESSESGPANSESLRPQKFFYFFNLPFELRRKVLSHLLVQNRIIDLDPANAISNPFRLNLFLTSRRMHEEAYQVFYSIHTFRIFPIHPRYFGGRVKSVLSRLSPRYRAALVSLEIRLGIGWSKPPKTWTVTDRLGLQDCTRVKNLEVFVECDPSHEIFHGFRISVEFFTDFSSNLLESIVKSLPYLEWVTFNRHGPSVSRDSELMSRLQEAVLKGQKRIAWAKDKWVDDEEGDRKTQSACNNFPSMSAISNVCHSRKRFAIWLDVYARCFSLLKVAIENQSTRQ